MTKSSPQPITTHRLFPAIVALWFAALLGIGSFVVPPALLERLVSATGLPAIVPAAAPPLGFTARVLVALLMTGLGAFIGIVISLRLRPRGAAGSAPRRRFSLGTGAAAAADGEPAPRRRARDAHPDAPARRPVAASEDLGEPLDAPTFETTTGPIRRRALVSAGSAEPEVQELAGAEFEVADSDAEAAPFAPPLHASMPLVALDERVEDAPFDAELDLAEFEDVASQDDDAAIIGVDPVPAQTFSAPHIPAPAERPTLRSATPSPVARQPVRELGTVQLVERLALAMAARSKSPAPAPAAPTAELRDLQAAAMFAEPSVEPAQEEHHVFAEAEGFGLPHDEELVEESAPVTAGSEVEPEPELSAPAPSAPEPAAPGPAASEPQRAFDRPGAPASSPVVPLRPLALDPVQIDDEDHEDHELPTQVQRFLGGSIQSSAANPPAPPVVPSRVAPSETQAPADAGIEADDDTRFALPEPLDADRDAGDDERFPSLLDIGRGAKPEAAHAIAPATPAPAPEIEPVVVFPGQGPRPFAPPPNVAAARAATASLPGLAPAAPAGPDSSDPAETDRALRAALATLQRMTGSR